MPTEIRQETVNRAARALRARYGRSTALCSLEPIPGQASNRRYFRMCLSGPRVPRCVILVQLPPDPFAEEEAVTGKAPAELPFCTMLRYLESRRLPVPRLIHDGSREGFLIQEDLGSETLFVRLLKDGPAQHEEHYRRAIDLLVRFQRATREPPRPGRGPQCIGFKRSFGADLLRWELDHFKEWLLLDHAKAQLETDEERALDLLFDRVVERLTEVPYRLAHRDYQSTNLMVRDGQLILIDFQDALMAPPAYDLVALLRDSYIPLSRDEMNRLRGCYYEAAASFLPFPDEEAFATHFHLQTLQRKLKDAGRFVFIDREKGNPDFLRWIEPTLGYVKEAFAYLPEWRELQDLLGRHVPELRAHS